MKTLQRRMTQKGQVTIPAEMRAALGLKPRDRVEFTLDGNEVRLAPAESTIRRWYGAVPALDPPMTDRELREAFERDVADEVMSEG